jgi:hypothetical protein
MTLTTHQGSAMRIILLCALFVSVSAVAAERPLIGDVENGERLLKGVGAKVKVDGAWLNRMPDGALVKSIEEGKNGMPEIEGDTILDAWDVLAAYRAKNTDLRDLAGAADTVYFADTTLDDNAKERLKTQGKIASGKITDKRGVFALFDLESGGKGVGAGDFTFISSKESRKRDTLKRDKKVGYAVFLPLPGFRGGKYEVAFGIDKDMKITQAFIRAENGDAPDDLNQAAQRFVGKGARGKYDSLKAGGAGKAISELAGPLSDAYLLAAEAVYMFEVEERDYFAFD